MVKHDQGLDKAVEEYQSPWSGFLKVPFGKE